MRTHWFKIPAAALLAAGAMFALSACGGGGNGASPVAMEDPGPEPPTEGEVAAGAALAAYNTAKTTYEAAIAAYEADPNQMTAEAAASAADALQAAAMTARTTATAGGNSGQQLAAAEAVLYADRAAMAAGRAVADAQAASDAAAAVQAASDALAAYDTAVTAYDTAKAAHDTDMSLANAEALHEAATDLKTAADAALAAAMDGGTAAQQMLAAANVRYADAVVASATAIAQVARGEAEAAEAAEMAAAEAIAKYDAAKAAYDAAEATYDSSMANTVALRAAATALKEAADAAVTAAANGGTADHRALASAAQRYAAGAALVADAAEAFDAHGDAKAVYDTAKAAYDAENGMTLANARAMQTAALALQTAADAAVTAAANGTTAQKAAAATAKAAADGAVSSANALVALETEKSSTAGQLAAIQKAASDAADAAATASTAAAMAATAAMEAVDGRAMFQTVNSSRMPYYAARNAAKAASDAAKAAATAAAEAAEATTFADASSAQRAAEVARDNALEAQTMAETSLADALKAAMAEVFVDDETFSVGEAAITLTDETVTENSKVTGLVGAPDTTVPMVEGMGWTAAVDDPPDTVDTEYVQAIAARTFDIGTTIDADDDTARLMLVTRYAGIRNVPLFAYAAGDTVTGRPMSGGRILTAGVDTNFETDDDVIITLKSVGMFTLAGDPAAAADGLTHEDEVSDDAKSEQVYSYVPEGATEPVYVIERTTSVTDGITTRIYQPVDIDAVISDDEVDGTDDDPRHVRVDLPVPKDYKHINFGVWNALDDGDEISDLGVGFVHSIGDGLTGDDMPNNGGATYKGNWVAAVRAADHPGPGRVIIQQLHGDADIVANFRTDKISADLIGLAELTGTVTGNTFAGDTATVGSNTAGLTAGADFDGEFHGGFFGKKAQEVGGVFAFDGDEEGAFAGAFGGNRTDED